MIDIKISLGSECNLEEAKKFGFIDYKIALMPQIGECIFLSENRLASANNMTRNRVREGYNYVNAIIYGDDGLPIVMLGKNPKLIEVELCAHDTIITLRIAKVPKIGELIEDVMINGSSEMVYIEDVVYAANSGKITLMGVGSRPAQLIELKANHSLNVWVENELKLDNHYPLAVDIKNISSDAGALPVDIQYISSRIDNTLPVEIKKVDSYVSDLPVVIKSADLGYHDLPVCIRHVDSDVCIKVKDY